MKNLVFVILFVIPVLFSNTVYAQDNAKKQFNSQKTEVNIAISNLFSKNNLWPYYYIDNDGTIIYSTYSTWSYYPVTQLVLGIKFHNAKGAVRLGTTLHYSQKKNEETAGASDKQKYNEFNMGIYVGYEWHSTFNRVNIYYGFDVSSYFQNYHYTNEYQSNSSEFMTNEISVGINPLVGINFFITPHLSLGTEAKFMMEYVSGKSKSTNNGNYGQNETETKSSGFRTRFGPLGFLSINIHF